MLDANVVIAAALSPTGAPATVVQAWLDGAFEFVASPLLLDELARAFGYAKIRARVPEAEAGEMIELIRRSADIYDDPEGPYARRSPDPGDDYVLALAEAAQAVIVSGDHHLLSLAKEFPVYTPAAFLAMLASLGG